MTIDLIHFLNGLDDYMVLLIGIFIGSILGAVVVALLFYLEKILSIELPSKEYGNCPKCLWPIKPEHIIYSKTHDEYGEDDGER